MHTSRLNRKWFVWAVVLAVLIPMVALAAAYAGVDSFDSYSDGDLTLENGGSGFAAAWTGSTIYDVEGTVTCNGSAKAVVANTVSNTSNTISRLMSAGADSGDIYYCMRVAGTGPASNVELHDTGEVNIAAYVQLGLNRIGVSHNGGFDILQAGISANTWYIFNINILSATTFKVRWKVAGGTFSAFTGDLTFRNSVSSPTTLRLTNSGEAGTTDLVYYDQFGTTDPDVAPAVGVKFPMWSIRWW